jgi:hypothetical protein
VIWQNRSGSMFTGTPINFTGGESGLSTFAAASGAEATPPWAWQGDQICAYSTCWNSWGQDGLLGGSMYKRSPTSSISAGFLTAPDREVAFRIRNIPELNVQMRYNPYLSSPPDYSIGSVLPFTAMIVGQDLVNPGNEYTYSANPMNGTPPYSYGWSGALSGGSESISGTFWADDVLILEIWDSAGLYAQTILPITVLCSSGTEISC